MLRHSRWCAGGFVMQHVQGTGIWDEDHVNDYRSRRYLSARKTMLWYYDMERHQSMWSLRWRRNAQSANNNAGLHHSGYGAFERELQRRGVPVEKYALTTTTGARRVAELVQLRRRKLEQLAARVQQEQQQQQPPRERPSPSWYDETRGPLNPRFLHSMQHLYTQPMTELPPSPITHDATALVSTTMTTSSKDGAAVSLSA